MIYIAAAFTFLQPQERRYCIGHCLTYMKKLAKLGQVAYAPLVYSSGIENVYNYEQWIAHGLAIIEACTEVHVITYKRWADSVGVAKEMKKAESLGLPVFYVDVDEGYVKWK